MLCQFQLYSKVDQLHVHIYPSSLDFLPIQVTTEHRVEFPELDTTAAAKSLQSCPTLCDPRDGSPPGSPVPGILQVRKLEWVAISFSNARK